jgi:hypothetical protein
VDIGEVKREGTLEPLQEPVVVTKKKKEPEEDTATPAAEKENAT